MHSDDSEHTPPHQLLDFLPAIYRRSPALGPFLAAFEETLFRGAHSVEMQIARIPKALDPFAQHEREDEFLPWLAQWAAITLYHEARDRRRVIAGMIQLYRIRGTPDYITQTLELYVDGVVTVEDPILPGMAVGVSARVGQGTRLGEDPFQFSVRVDFAHVPRDRQQRLRLIDLARRVIDLAKPAYTHYHFSHNLFDEERGFIIGVRSTVGVDTLLEHAPSPSRERHSR